MSSVWSIRRSTADKKLAGVCGGVARHWNVDPVLVRVGWVLLALSGGVGIVLYVAAWLLVPADGATTSTMDDLTKGQTRGWPREAWVAIVAVACLVTFAVFSSTTSIGFGPAVVLALIWYFGYYKSRVKSSAPPPPPPGALTPPPTEPFRYPGPATPFTEAADAWRQRVQDMQRAQGPTSPTVPSPSPQPPPVPAPPRTVPASSSWQTYPYAAGPSSVQDPPGPELAEASARADFLAAADPVGLYTEAAPAKPAAAPSRRTAARSLSARRLRLVGLLALGLVLLGLAIADTLGVPVSPLVYAASALLVVGLTLIAATWLGRARGILPIGLVLLLVVLGMAAVRPGGQLLHDVTYTSAAEFVGQPLAVDHGVVTVDLTDVALTSDATFAADLGVGAIELKVPSGTNVVLDYAVGNGAVVDGDTTLASGANLSGSAPLGRPAAGEPTLTLDVEVKQGVLVVKR